ncbi:MAG: hypothetical protein WBW53_11455 [Terriglobales bacterium]
MNYLLSGLCALAIVFIASLGPLQAQTTTAAQATRPFTYEVSEEVTITGTVTSVLTKAAPGMVAGSHLLLATPSGPVDASLGKFGLRGDGAVSVSAGQQIDATGVMKTIHDEQIFIVRTLKVGDAVYTIRNNHGVSLSPQARQRTGQKTSEKGELL